MVSQDGRIKTVAGRVRNPSSGPASPSLANELRVSLERILPGSRIANGIHNIRSTTMKNQIDPPLQSRWSP